MNITKYILKQTTFHYILVFNFLIKESFSLIQVQSRRTFTAKSIMLSVLALRNFARTNFYAEAHNLCFGRHPYANSRIQNLPNKMKDRQKRKEKRLGQESFYFPIFVFCNNVAVAFMFLIGQSNC